MCGVFPKRLRTVSALLMIAVIICRSPNFIRLSITIRGKNTIVINYSLQMCTFFQLSLILRLLLKIKVHKNLFATFYCSSAVKFYFRRLFLQSYFTIGNLAINAMCVLLSFLFYFFAKYLKYSVVKAVLLCEWQMVRWCLVSKGKPFCWTKFCHVSADR